MRLSNELRCDITTSTDGKFGIGVVATDCDGYPTPLVNLHFTTGAGLEASLVGLDAEALEILSNFCRQVARQLRK